MKIIIKEMNNLKDRIINIVLDDKVIADKRFVKARNVLWHQIGTLMLDNICRNIENSFKQIYIEIEKHKRPNNR